MAKLLILGATGAVAQQLIHQFEEQAPADWTLRLFVRTPQRLTAEQRRDYQVVVGDAFDPQAIAQALQDVTVVYSNLGDYAVDRFAASILQAVTDRQVAPHLVWLAGAGIEGEATGETARVAHADPVLFQQHQTAVAAIKDSGLTYTILRPVLLTDTARQTPQIIPSGMPIQAQTVSRATVAQVALTACLTTTYDDCSIGIAE